jgi:two-component system sensor histidine kinase KdpD
MRLSVLAFSRVKGRAMSLVEITPLADRPQRTGPWASYALSLVFVGIASFLAVAVDRKIAIPNVSLIFVLPVVVAAIRYGWGPALSAAVAGAVAYNFLLIEPRYTFRVADPANIWALALLLITASAVSAVAAQSRRRALQAWEAVAQSSALQAMAGSLVAARDSKAIARTCAETLTRVFDAPAVIFVADGDDLRLTARAGAATVTAADEDAAAWVLASRLPVRGGAYPIDGCAYDLWPVQTPRRQRAVIGVQISGREDGRPESPERFVETVAGYLAVALEREANARAAVESQVAVASERMKSDLLAAVSHDLKTPLSTILVTLQSLRTFGDAHDASTRTELLASAEAEASRLSAMVVNLLDMNRLEAGAVPVRPAATAPQDLVARAIERTTFALSDRRVVNEVGGAAGFLMVDASLFETALANILENAAKYSPPGSNIHIRAGENRRTGWIEVLDEGPGFPGAIEPLFERFTRGVAGDGRPPGTGLGLTIARGFLEAQGGRIGAANRTDRTGAIVRLVAPLAPARRVSA